MQMRNIAFTFASLFLSAELCNADGLRDYIRACHDKTGLATIVREAHGTEFENTFIDQLFKSGIDSYFLANPIDFVLLRDVEKLIKMEGNVKPILAVYLYDAQYSEGDSRISLLSSSLKGIAPLKDCDIVIRSAKAPQQAMFILYYEDLRHSTFALKESEGEYLFERVQEK